jgi:hypothetical protein
VARPQPLPVARGANTDIELVATPIVTHVNVAITERKGQVYVDGHVVGEGFFDGDLPVGEHAILLARDGYEQFEKEIVLVEGKPYLETVSLAPITVVGGASSPTAMHGGYGGIIANMSFQPDGVHGDLAPPCSIQSGPCSASAPVGGGLLGYAGFTAGVVGIDALFGIQADTGKFDVAPAGGSPASLTLARGGGLAALRARIGWQTPEVRLTFAAGVGAAVHVVRVIQDGNFWDLFGGSSGEKTYAAPGITLEGAIRWRVGTGTALSLGMLFWGENAGSGVNVQVSPLQGSVRAVSGTQAFFLPFLGLEFGP